MTGENRYCDVCKSLTTPLWYKESWICSVCGTITDVAPTRLEVRRAINKAGHVFFESMCNTNKELGHIAGEFMALNEEYVLNHSGEHEETNGTVDILQAGFTTNQLKFLERLCVALKKSSQGESACIKE